MSSTEPETVELYVFGLKTILPAPVTAKANLDQTWYDFFNNDCNIPVTPENKVIVCTTAFNLRGTRGWSAALHEKIRPFIDKFTVKKDKYSVRIALDMLNSSDESGGNDNSLEHDNQMETDNNSQDPLYIPVQVSHESGNSKKKRTYPGSSKRNDSVPIVQPVVHSPAKSARNSFAIGSRIYRSGSEVVEEEVEDDFPLNVTNHLLVETDEEAPLPTNYASNVQVHNPFGVLRTSNGTRAPRRRNPPDILSLTKQRTRRFTNAFLLRVKHEIKAAKEKNLWDRCVQHSPYGCYLLQELFADTDP